MHNRLGLRISDERCETATKEKEMSDKPNKVLLVEDNLQYAHLIRAMVSGGGTGFELTHVERLSDALEHLSKESWDVVLLDLLLPDSHGLDTMVKVQAQAPSISIVVLTGLDDEALAIKAMQKGAQDYLVKGQVDGNLLKRSIRYAIERKRAEGVFKTLAISSPIGIYIVQDRVFQLVSPQFQELVGYSEDELLGMESLIPVHPEDRETVREKAIKMLKAGPSSPYEYRYISKSGQTKWVLETVASIQYRGRRATMGNFLDITERKQAEEKIQRQNEFLNDVLESITLPFYVVDTNDYTIKMANSATQAGDLSENPTCYAITHKRSKPCGSVEHLCPLEKIKETQKPIVVEHLHYDKDNIARYVEVHGYPIFDSEGNVTQMIEYCLDLTERKQAEEERRELDRMKSEFIANISHELRTPLHSIRGFARLMLQDKVPKPEVQMEFLGIIDNQSKNLEKLIDDLLDASRLESGRFKIQKHRLLIKDVISEVVGDFYTIASEKGITINTDIPEALPEVEADGKRLKQVLNNLLSNAIKFSNGGTHVTVTGATRDSELMVRVTDQGVGMPEEVMQHLFERFYRAKDTARVGGTGLGLYISKQIIEAHGGHILVESKVGEGSTFSFTLPLIQTSGDSNE